MPDTYQTLSAIGSGFMDYEKYGEVFRKGNVTLINCDCMDLMADAPENHWQLSIIDPPYGIDAANTFGGNERKSGNGAALKTDFEKKDWDIEIPDADYFFQLMRVSKNQIIWGANYMSHFLPPSMGWIVWNKDNGTTKFSDAELAFTSFERALRVWKYTWNGMIQGDMKNKERRIHPTQKPVKLYDWLLASYAKPGDRILDTHLGSGSSAIAAHYAGHDFVGIELDKDYFKAAKKRFDESTKQEALF
jgi:site-specific DNA-methyltransferase (adenine-specific)